MRAGEPFRENGDVFVSMGYLHSLDAAEATPPGFQATGAYRERQTLRQGREGKLTHSGPLCTLTVQHRDRPLHSVPTCQGRCPSCFTAGETQPWTKPFPQGHEAGR